VRSPRRRDGDSPAGGLRTRAAPPALAPDRTLVPVLVLPLPPRPAPLLVPVVPVVPAVGEVPVAGCVSVPVSPSETSGLLSLLQAAVASSAVVANTHTLFVIIAQLHVGSEPIIRGLSFTRVTEDKEVTNA